ncbi:MAG: ribosomal L7Ae/L30e/S12e/Gadd45 family protein [Clostridia bacterium]|nr:ribosomal L7Ae/L30e/S12e/Gadd45 family protein [Clostridia bacterium]MBQ6613851.1 ribosomal L7Ae/L30e/S12e/Gadd45 family protein [Clostridia bacterium]
MANTDIKRALSMIGLCKKAGRLTSGVPLVCDAVREGRAFLTVYASGASENSVKRVCDKCKSYETLVKALDVTPEELAKAIGKSGAVAAVAILDRGFAEAIEKILNS